MPEYAFSETKEATLLITKLFDFVWPTAVALWNMRWQVNGFLSVVPSATNEEVNSRFVIGSDIRGADIRAMVKNISWDQQKETFAEFILTNAFAIYEGWAKQIIRLHPLSGFSEKDLYSHAHGQTKGLLAYINTINASASPVMTSAFKPQFQKHKKNLPSLLNNMLVCYRYFKQVRNCQIHNNGIADSVAVQAYTAFQKISSAHSLGTNEAIDHYPLVVGKKTRLSLRGVVGFCDILLKLMITIDASLSGSTVAEVEALKRLRKKKGPMLMLGSRTTSVSRKVRKLCTQAELPVPCDIDVAKQFLIANRLVKP